MTLKRNILFAFLLIIKIIALVLFHKGNLKSICSVNPDEMLIAEVAINYHKGLGYVSSQEISSNHQYNKTALRPSYPIFIHIALMGIYQRIYPNDILNLSTQHTYFIAYSLLIQTISFIVYACSLYAFYQIASVYFKENKNWVIAATIFYGVYPSVLLYVGALTNYENIALPLVVIVFYFFLKSLEKTLSFADMTIITLSVIIATCVRPQTLPIFACMIVFVLLQSLLTKKYFLNKLAISVIVCVCLVMVNIPVFLKNKNLFGEYFLSTQAGFSFFEGHNPFARGSWCGDCGINPQRPVYQYVRDEIKNFNQLNEFERSNALRNLAWQWIKSNPFEEIKLTLRKIAIYFLPYNSDNNYFNIFNFTAHVGFFLFLVLLLFRKQALSYENVFVLMPMLGSLIVSIIFFVGYRWRYYAEPFIILTCFLFLKEIFKKKYANP